jgi:hypothetical protein
MQKRDLIGYGAERPRGRWANGASLAVSLVSALESKAPDFARDGR